MEEFKNINFDSNPRADSVLKVTYNGCLNYSNELWIVYGFDESWNNTSEVKMNKTEQGFEANVNILDYKTFNFCFKNSNNEWDNNNSCNYISSILPSYDSELISLFDELFNTENSFSESVETISETNETEEFDIDKLIEEILQPIVEEKIENFTEEDLVANTISESVIELTEKTNEKNNIELAKDENYLETNEIKYETEDNEDSFDLSELSFEYTNENISNEENLSSPVKPQFAISPRRLSKFYLFRKRVRLLFYKLARLPQLIFGDENN